MTSFGVISVEKGMFGMRSHSTTGYDLTDPTVVVPPTRKAFIPEPEFHFPFRRHSW